MFKLVVFIVLCVTLQSINAVTNTAPVTTVVGNYDMEDKYKVFEHRVAFTLTCNVTSQKPRETFELQWFKEDTALTKHTPRVELHKDSITVRKPTVDDAGSYSCKLVDPKSTNTTPIAQADFELIMKPTAKLIDTLTVMEGEKLRLECLVVGYPPPTVEWRIGNVIYLRSEGRVKLIEDPDKRAANSVLEIDQAVMSDRGHYYCHGNNLATRRFNVTEATVYVRVKDKMAALWPFLGICIEIVALGLIIIIYEKKRNKTELDESDTDQSPEQDKK